MREVAVDPARAPTKVVPRMVVLENITLHSTVPVGGGHRGGRVMATVNTTTTATTSGRNGEAELAYLTRILKAPFPGSLGRTPG